MEQPMSRAAFFARAVALLLLIAATGYALGRWAVKPLRCTYAASTGVAVIDASPPGDPNAKRVALTTRSALKQCDCVTPPDAIIAIARAAAASANGEPGAAISQYRQALLIDRRPELYFQLSLLQHEVLDHEGSVDSMVRACAFDPATINGIPFADLRQQTEQRLREKYGADWIP
jgi:hypothetical protein